MKPTKYELEAPKRERMVREALESGDVSEDAIRAAKLVANNAMRGYPKPRDDYWDEVFVHELYALLFTRTGRRRK